MFVKLQKREKEIKHPWILNFQLSIVDFYIYN